MSTNCIVASKMPSPPVALIMPTAKITTILPQTPAMPAVMSAITHISRSSSTQQQCDTDSGKSSCSPALLDCSFDSGICLDVNDVKLHRQLQDFKRILLALERDREMYRLLRERLSKIVDRKNKKQKQEEEVFCNVCCAEIDPENVKCFVQCSMCQKVICRDTKCADWIPSNAQWECQLCHASKESLALTSSWVAEQASFSQHKFIYPMRARSEIYIPISSDHNEGSLLFESVSQVGGAFPTAADAATAITAEQKLKIREYVEEVVAQMLGGSLENIAVGRLSQSENYLPALANGVLRSNNSSNNNNNNPAPSDNNGDLTDISHTRLRQLIESIIAETLHLQQPALSSSTAVSEVAIDTHSNGGATTTLPNGDARRHRTEHYFEPKIYQELLATAVLNKIADTHGNARHLTESGPDLLATADLNRNFKEHPGTLSSGSSVEPQSDCSFTDTEQILNLSKGEDFSPCGSHANLNAEIMAGIQMDAGRESALSDYIAAHMVPLPDLSAPVTESEEDDYVSITSSQLGDGNWEDNWLFKKKKSSMKTPVTAGGVGMLVPAPREDVRAQIGDKIADEISDLSEVGSETDDSSLDLMRSGQMDPLNDRLLSKHLIGGQNTKLVLDELIDNASVICCTSPAENEPVYTETKNAHVVKTTTTNEAINIEVTKSVLTHSPPSVDTNTEPCEPVILPPPMSFDDDDIAVDINVVSVVTNGTNCDKGNPITATANLLEVLRATEGCTGFSTEVEVFDTDPNESSCQSYGNAAIPSVVEILAAIALGPMLAVPASEQQAVLTPIEMTSLKELSDLALAEIKARTQDPNYQILGVIPEENIEDTSLEFTNNSLQAIETIQTKSEILLDSNLIAAEIVPIQTKNDAISTPVNSDCITTSTIETVVMSTVASIVFNSKNYEETINSVAPVVEANIDPSLDAGIENNEPKNQMVAESTEIVPSAAEAVDISTLEMPQVCLPPVIETVIVLPTREEVLDINVPPHVLVPSAAEKNVFEIVSTTIIECDLPPSVIAENTENMVRPITETVDSSVQRSEPTLTVETELPLPVVAESQENNVVLSAETLVNTTDVTEVLSNEPPIIETGTPLPAIKASTHNIASLATETIDSATEGAPAQENVSTLTVETDLPPPVVAENLENNVVLIAAAERNTQNIAPLAIEAIDSPAELVSVQENVSTFTVVTELPLPVVAEDLDSINSGNVTEVPSIEAPAAGEGSTQNTAPLAIETIDITDMSSFTVETELPPIVVTEKLENNVVLIAETSVNSANVSELASIETPAAVEGITQNIAPLAIETIDITDMSSFTVETELPPIVVTEKLENNVVLIAETSVNSANVSELASIETPAAVEGITQNIAPLAIETINIPHVSTLTVETKIPPPVVAENLENNVVMIAEDSVNPANVTEVPSIETPAAVEGSTQNIAPLAIEAIDSPAELVSVQENVSTFTVVTELPLPVVAEDLDSINSGNVTEVPSIEAPAAVEGSTQNIAPLAIETINITDLSTLTVETKLPSPVVAENLENYIVLIAETSFNSANVTEVTSFDSPVAVEESTQNIAPLAIETINITDVSTLTIETKLPPPVVEENLKNNVVMTAETSVNSANVTEVPSIETPAAIEGSTQNIAPLAIETIVIPDVSSLTVETEQPPILVTEKLENNVVLIAETSFNSANITELASIEIPAAVEGITQNIAPLAIETIDIPDVSTLTVETKLPPPVVAENLENNVVMIAQTSVNPANVTEVPSNETPAAVEESTQNIAPLAFETIDSPAELASVQENMQTLIIETELPLPIVTQNLENVAPAVDKTVENPSDSIDMIEIVSCSIVESVISSPEKPQAETVVYCAEVAKNSETLPPAIVKTAILPVVLESTENIEPSEVRAAVSPEEDAEIVTIPIVVPNILPSATEIVNSPAEAAELLEIEPTSIIKTLISTPFVAVTGEKISTMVSEAVISPGEAAEIIPSPIIEAVNPPPVLVESTENAEAVINHAEATHVPETVSPLIDETVILTADRGNILSPAVDEVVECLGNVQLPIVENVIPPPVEPENTQDILPPLIVETVNVLPVVAKSTETVALVVPAEKSDDQVITAETVILPPVVDESIENISLPTPAATVNPAEAEEIMNSLTIETSIPSPIVLESLQSTKPPSLETTDNIAQAVYMPPPILDAVILPPVVAECAETVATLIAEAIANPAETADKSENPKVETVIPLPMLVDNIENIALPVAKTITFPDATDVVVSIPTVGTAIPPPIVENSSQNIVFLAAECTDCPADGPEIIPLPVAKSIVYPVAAVEIVSTSIIEAKIHLPMVMESSKNCMSSVTKNVDVSEIDPTPIVETIILPHVAEESKENVAPLIAETLVNLTKGAEVADTLIDPSEKAHAAEIGPLPILDTVIHSDATNIVSVVENVILLPEVAMSTESLSVAIDSPAEVGEVAPPADGFENIVTPQTAKTTVEKNIKSVALPADKTINTRAEAVPEIVPNPTHEIIIPPTVSTENIEDIPPPIAENIVNSTKKTDLPEIVSPKIVENLFPLNGIAKSTENITASVNKPVVSHDEDAKFVQDPIIEIITSPAVVEGKGYFIPPTVETAEIDDVQEIVPPLIVETVIPPTVAMESSENLTPLLSEILIYSAEASIILLPPVAETIISLPVIVDSTDNTVHLAAKAEDNSTEMATLPETMSLPTTETVIPPLLVTECTENILPFPIVETSPQIVASTEIAMPPSIVETAIPLPLVAKVTENISQPVVGTVVNPDEVLEIVQLPITEADSIIPPSVVLESLENIVPENVPVVITETVIPLDLVSESTEKIAPLPVVETVTQSLVESECTKMTVLPPINETIISLPVVAKNPENIVPLEVETEVAEIVQSAIAETIIPSSLLMDSTEDIVLPSSDIDEAGVREIVSKIEITETLVPAILLAESIENNSPFDTVIPSPVIVLSTETTVPPLIVETIIPLTKSAEDNATQVVETVVTPAEEPKILRPAIVEMVIPLPVKTKNSEITAALKANAEATEIFTPPIVQTFVSSHVETEDTERIMLPPAAESVSAPIVESVIPPPVIVEITENIMQPVITESMENIASQVTETIENPNGVPEVSEIAMHPIVETLIASPVVAKCIENILPLPIVETVILAPVVEESTEYIALPLDKTVDSTVEEAEVQEFTAAISHEIISALPVVVESTDEKVPHVTEIAVNLTELIEVTETVQPPAAVECEISLPIAADVSVSPLATSEVESIATPMKVQETIPIPNISTIITHAVVESTENATPALDETVGNADVATASSEMLTAPAVPPSTAENDNTSAKSEEVQEIPTLIVETTSFPPDEAEVADDVKLDNESFISPIEAVEGVDIVPPTKIDTDIAPAVVLSTENVTSPVAETVGIPAVEAELLELVPVSSTAETDVPEIVSHSNVETIITPSAYTESTDCVTAPAAKSEIFSAVEVEAAAQRIAPATEIIVSCAAELEISEILSPPLTEHVATLALSTSTESCVTVPESENSQALAIEVQEVAVAKTVVAKIVTPIIDEISIAENPETIALPTTATETATPGIVPPSFTETIMSCSTAAEPVISAMQTGIDSIVQTSIASTTPSASTETVFPSDTTEWSDSLLPQVIEHAAIAPPAIVSQEASAADDTIASSSPEETVIATPVIVPDTDLVEPVPSSVDEPKPQEIIVHSDNLESNTISDDFPPDMTHVVGNITRRGLTRQCNVIDTTPSVDEAQPKGVSLLATICKCYIKDKRLLKSLENRRRQTILIQRYLNSFDSMESEEYPNDILLTEHTSIFTPETPYPIENEHEHENFVVGELSELSFNFFNNVLFSDQLSSDSNNTEGSIATAVETFVTDERSPAAQLCAAPAQCDEYEYGFNSSSIVLTPATNHHLTHKKTTTTTTTNTNLSTTITNHKTNVQLTNGSIAGVHKSAACSEEPLLRDDEEQEHVDDDLVVMRRFVPGSIAEREYKKWYNAVDMPNNPYAPEALKRRISGSQERFIDLPNISPSTEQNPISLIQNASKDEIDQSEERDYKRYSRDYYINDTKQSPTNAANIMNSMKSSSTTTLTGGSQESTTDITINEAQIANTSATAITTSPSQDEHIFQAIPAQVVEDPASLDTQSTLSNQSIQSTTTTTSDDSDTIRIYDFKKQETTVIRDPSSNMTTSAIPEPTAAVAQSTTVESNTMLDAPVVRKARPTQLAITSSVGSNSGDPEITLGLAGVITSPFTPTRGSTPTAFKFLQPKRKLIEPSQVLSFDEEGVVPPPTPVERKTIEEDVAQALPSVKALAQAFLMTSHKRSQVEKRWLVKSKLKTSLTPTEENVIMQPKPTSPQVPTKKHLEASPSYAEAAEDATIASDLSSLETDPPTEHETKDSKAVAEKTSPSPLRAGFLKSNIAFFENLKFK